MKFGGITWWRNNFGSILQAYALQQIMNSIPDVEYEIINQFGKKIVSVDNFIDKIKTIGIRKTMHRTFWKMGIKKLRRRSKRLQAFVDTYLNISDVNYSKDNIHKANSEYDGFICGSDQIWNPTLTSFDSIYWLGFAEKGKARISYAPSIGVKSVSNEEKKIIRNNLSSFTAVSCREDEGTTLINSIIENKCTTVVDPTLLVDKKIWDDLSSHKMIDSDYIFVYLLRGDKNQKNIIEKFAKENDLVVATVPFLETEYAQLYDFYFGDIKLWTCTPDEFISYIRHAKYVFTDSFHSMIFSCIYHKDFFVFPKKGKSQMTRIENLHKSFEINSRIIQNYEDIERINTTQTIDWDRVEKIICEKKNISLKYIEDSILRSEL